MKRPKIAPYATFNARPRAPEQTVRVILIEAARFLAATLLFPKLGFTKVDPVFLLGWPLEGAMIVLMAPPRPVSLNANMRTAWARPPMALSACFSKGATPQ